LHFDAGLEHVDRGLSFLEGGVAWGCSLVADLVSQWEKRNGRAIRDLDLTIIDRARLAELFKEFGDEKMSSRFAEFDQMIWSRPYYCAGVIPWGNFMGAGVKEKRT
jgi:hypothetical protein